MSAQKNKISHFHFFPKYCAALPYVPLKTSSFNRKNNVNNRKWCSFQWVFKPLRHYSKKKKKKCPKFFSPHTSS